MAWLTKEEAIARLGVRPQTLYAYVSRGRLEARPDPANPRRSLYSAEDVATLDARRRAPRKAADIAADAIAWGEPVLASALTTVSRGRLYYRGHDAIRLSEHASLEQAAALFWNTPFAVGEAAAAAPAAAGAMKAALFAALCARASVDGPLRGRGQAALGEEAAQILEHLASAVAGAGPAPVHERLARAWRLDERGADLVRRTLVLMLDHELNPSTFAARVAASTGASLAASALAGLATLSGPLHGAAVEAVLRFVRECARIGAREAVRARLEEGLALPGFGHNLYPEGDPRAAALLATMHPPRPILAVCEAARDAKGLAPNVDLAVAALAVTLDLPAGAPFALFALGRCVGWLGHAMEQAETGALIRPRARYVGPPPA